MAPRSLFAKLRDAHVVRDLGGGRLLVHIDRHLIHDVTSPQAFASMREKGRRVRHPELTFATADHIVSTSPGRGDETVPGGAEMIRALRDAAREHGFRNYDIGDPDQGIVHVIGPELGLALPGLTIVCGDSHTTTLGALGAWAWGIGTSDVEHTLVTQTLTVAEPRTMRATISGAFAKHVSAKDLILALIAQIGVDGALGHALEFAGTTVSALDMESRFTLCNMAVEASARTALVAPDDTTFAYVEGRPLAPKGAAFARAVAAWRELPGDSGASFDREVALDATALAPRITWGTDPAQNHDIDAAVPAEAPRRALDYQGIEAGKPLLGLKLGKVFIGSCTNARLSDLRAAAAAIAGRKVAAHVRAVVVPGSGRVKREAEALRLHETFLRAGFEWREPGCSMCAGLNDDRLAPFERCLATSNRNFEGRQGPNTRTHLASPATAAASAIAGAIADPREVPG
jgi:3-isopropylmalate/(R)-2-methylmalate dehydratase large subunit